jgi:hypothetical protein
LQSKLTTCLAQNTALQYGAVLTIRLSVTIVVRWKAVMLASLLYIGY